MALVMKLLVRWVGYGVKTMVGNDEAQLRCLSIIVNLKPSLVAQAFKPKHLEAEAGRSL